MKYVKGNQTYPISADDKTMPTWKCRMVCNGADGEGIWVKQGEGEIVLLNDSLHFLPFRTWGAVFPSASNPKDTNPQRETIDVARYRGESPDDCVITLHPEAWAAYLEHGVIDEEGNFLGEGKEEDEVN
jgi:hypothetical protein